jgi:arylsulfatase A-like enzyme
VKPFAPMNALEKLLHANGYRLTVGLDSIMSQLLEPSPAIDELDRGRNVMDYEFCRTLGELESKLQRGAGSARIFAYSLPQDIHMSRLPATVDASEDTRNFHAPYATKVRALDACFGAFIGSLKKIGLYRDSLIILTSDHGEMLGEDGRFGHSYHLFPQIVKVPLIVHLPESAGRRPADLHAVSLTTDIVPTIYDVLGYGPLRSNALMGRSLLKGDPHRRRDTFVIAASYGAVYATVRHNGRRLYIVDAIRGSDQAFERDRSGRWLEAPVSEGLRALNQLAIRRYVDEVARQYRFRVR